MPPPLPPTGEPGSPADEGPASGWMGGVQTLVLSVIGLLGDGLELLSLELRRGLRLLERLLWLLVLGSAALLTAWLFFWAGLALVLADAGMMWPLACAVVALANAGVLALCLSYGRLLRPQFSLPAVSRQLGLGSGDGAADPSMRARPDGQDGGRDARPGDGRDAT